MLPLRAEGYKLRRGKQALFWFALVGVVFLGVPDPWMPRAILKYRQRLLGELKYQAPPVSRGVTLGTVEEFCPNEHPEWREAQVIEGVEIERSPVCEPDNPYLVAAVVKGTNNVSHDTLMRAGLAPDAVVLGRDLDGDGDPDEVEIHLEVVELNGASPDTAEPVPGFAIGPGIRPAFWVFAPKGFGMATRSLEDLRANPLYRVPSPTIRVEQGDEVTIVLENTHYLPHSIHFHGVDHPYHPPFHPPLDLKGSLPGGDGVPETSEMVPMPGQKHIYRLRPRHAGTMLYHCHVQPQAHLLMGLQGLFVVEEQRPNNWVQTLNVGAGHVRHRSVAVRERYDREYDLHYMDLDKELHEFVQRANDPRLIAKAIDHTYDVTERTADYFLVNGRMFPYSLRDSLVVVKPNEKVKLRVANGGMQKLALHPHGHKVTITAYDGVDVNPVAWITRDVVDVDTAQRVDLVLDTTNDGLHSYGEGVWLLHDHHENAVTTDGVFPGGGITAIVYESYLDENGVPKVSGIDWKPFFSPEYYRKKIPSLATYGDDTRIFREPAEATPRGSRVFIWGLAAGLGMGAVVALFLGRRRR